MDLKETVNTKIVSKMMLRLLPMQVLLAAIASVNGFVSSFFATNYVGIEANAAIGLYTPISLLLTATGLMLTTGSSIHCGRYMGRGNSEKVQEIFSLSVIASVLIGIILALLALAAVAFDLTGFITQDDALRSVFNRYLLGQVAGIIPLLLGSQLNAFLTLENRKSRTIIASIAYITVNLLLNIIFVRYLHMQALGLAMSTSIGLWIFAAIEAEYFFSGKSSFRFRIIRPELGEAADMLRTGLAGGLSHGYQTLRGLIVNGILNTYIGASGLSAFTSAGNLLGLVWAVPTGMMVVSRLAMSESVGEEDRQTLRDITRVVFRIYIPVMIAVDVLIMISAVPLTHLFYHDPSQPVFMMTVWGLRLLPFAMPPAVVVQHFTGYALASGRKLFVHVISLFDGVLCVAGFTALLIGRFGMNSVYYANLLNGAVCILIIILHAWYANRHAPRDIDELLVIPEDFGAAPEDRLDFSVDSIEGVVDIAEKIQVFFAAKDVDKRRAYLSGLAMEEMAGNVVEHGFHKDNRKHSIDVRAVYKDGDIILRIRDDCVRFDPGERIRTISDNAGKEKNLGILMMFRIASEISYQNVLGLNVLTIRLDKDRHTESGH